MIKSISYDQKEILSWIQQLYCPHGFDLDPTYGYGGFYEDPERKQLCLPGEKDVKVYRPKLFFDLNRYTHGAWKADARHLPIKSLAIKSIIIDPPFLSQGGKNGKMVNRFGVAGDKGTPGEVWQLYKDIMTECVRVLKPFGHLIVKCQDQLHGRTQYMTQIEVTNYAIDLGLYPKDVFILLARSRHQPFTIKQNHARKWHSYFLVFGKQKRTVGYSRDPRKGEKG